MSIILYFSYSVNIYSIINNYSFDFREKRIELFNRLLNNIPNKKNIEIIDIGGSSKFWDYWKEYITHNTKITLVNISREEIKGNESIVGDAINLSFIRNKKYDVLFSNSLFEHLSTYSNQRLFAREINRIAEFYFIQTPAFMFPLEPHFLFPFFHWLPKRIRILLHQKFNLGWYNSEPNYLNAKRDVDEIRIMKKNELMNVFPKGKIIVEKYFLFSKSYIVTNMV